MRRLDEWQHRMRTRLDRFPLAREAWYYAWRPFCNLREWSEWPKADRPRWRPFRDIFPTEHITQEEEHELIWRTSQPGFWDKGLDVDQFRDKYMEAP